MINKLYLRKWGSGNVSPFSFCETWYVEISVVFSYFVIEDSIFKQEKYVKLIFINR